MLLEQQAQGQVIDCTAYPEHPGCQATKPLLPPGVIACTNRLDDSRHVKCYTIAVKPPLTTEEKITEWMHLSPFAWAVLAIYTLIIWRLRKQIEKLEGRDIRGA